MRVWTLHEAIEQCERAVWKGTRGERTAVHNAEQAAQFFGDAPLDEITTDRIDQFIDSLKEAGNTGGTVNRKLAALSKVLSHAHRRSHVSAMPHFEHQTESAGRVRYLTPEEEDQAVATLTAQGRLDHAEVLVVLVDTGLRPSELWRLEERDINYVNNTLTVWQPKNSHPRSIPMTRRVVSIMARRKDLVFPYANDWFSYGWDCMKRQLNLMHDKGFVPYALRHTCASRLIQRGVPIMVVKEWMGHKTIEITVRYAHLSPANLLEAVKVLEA